MSKPVPVVLAALTLLGIGGCGSDQTNQPDVDSSAPTRTVERTKVEVVEGLGKHGFNPTAIYNKLGDGVVTVVSLFGTEKELKDALKGGGSAGQTETIRPSSGMIVLHPSWQPRGERRYDGEGQRITIEFDLKPPSE